MTLNPDQLTVFLVSISLLLGLARLLGELMGRMKQAPIIGEILAGIILGPTVLGLLAPGLEEWLFPKTPQFQYPLDSITVLSAVMMLLVSGMEVDLSLLVRQGRAAFYTSLTGVIIPFGIGFGLARAFPEFLGLRDEALFLPFSLFMGTSMAISALPVIARTLMDLNIFKTDVGLVIIAAAMFDDLAGWIIFSIILGMIGSPVHGMDTGDKVMMVVAFVAMMLLVVRPVLNRLMPGIKRVFSYPGGVLTLTMVLGFLCAALTESMGMHAVFGGFILGVAIGDSEHFADRTREIINQFVTNVFAPLFFASIGLRVNFAAHFDLAVVVVILVIAYIGKVVGCGAGAWAGGFARNEALAVGFGMNSRGAMEIILGLLALQYGVIEERIFVALVIMALVTSLTSAPLMSLVLRQRKSSPVASLIPPEVVVFDGTSSREGVLRALAENLARRTKLDAEKIYREVMRQEAQTPSGVGQGLALPHAAFPVKSPLLAVGLSTGGVDFGGSDGIPSRLVMLLLTPARDLRVQYILLSELSRRFASRQLIEQLLESARPAELISTLRQIASVPAPTGQSGAVPEMPPPTQR